MPTQPRKLFTVLLSLMAVLPLTAIATELVIRDVTVVSSELARPLVHRDVLIDDGRIQSIQAADPASQAARSIDGSGHFLIPGLIDSHVHLNHATGLKRRYTDDFADLYAAYQTQLPRSYLYYGYTTVIENNGDPAVDRRFDTAPLHPRREDCGPALVLSNDFMATEFESSEEFFDAFPNFLHDRHTTPQLPDGLDPAAHTPAATVALIAQGGARCVKLYYEEALWWPGKQRPDFALPSVAIVKEVVAEAHARGLTVMLHGNTTNAHRFGLESGVDVMAHGLWDWAGATHGQAEIPTEVMQTVDAVAASQMWVQPTWMAVAGMNSLFEPSLLEDPRLAQVLPAAYLRYLHAGGQQARESYRQMFGPTLEAAFAKGDAASGELADIVATYSQRYRQILRRAHAAGGHLLFGTDTAVGTPGWGNPPGLSGYREMCAWVDADIDLATVLRAATLDNARAFGLADQIGTVEVGKRADLLLLSANPLDQVEAYDQIELVILDGKVIERQVLAADTPALVGIGQLAIPANDEKPEFSATLWYPAAAGQLQRVGRSRVRTGYLAVPEAEAAVLDQAPLVVLIHGSGGSASGMAWIATALAREGALVVGADHPDSSGGNPERASMMQVWNQPQDVHRLLDTVLSSTWGEHVDPSRIAVIGFSLGGGSAMLLAGGRLQLQHFPEFCRSHDDGACRGFAHHFAQFDADFYARANADLSDSRVRAAVAIAPGLSESFTADSLRDLSTPLLIISAQRDQQLPPATHVQPILPLLPAHSQYLEIADAQHFSFLPECGKGAIEVLAESQEEFVCLEFADRQRAAIHAETVSAIVSFLRGQSLLPTSPNAS